MGPRIHHLASDARNPTQIRNRRPCAGEKASPSCLLSSRLLSPLPVRLFEVWYPSNRAVTCKCGGSSRTVPPARTRSSAATPQRKNARFVTNKIHARTSKGNAQATNGARLATITRNVTSYTLLHVKSQHGKGDLIMTLRIFSLRFIVHGNTILDIHKVVGVPSLHIHGGPSLGSTRARDP